jgi:hypothetical protein
MRTTTSDSEPIHISHSLRFIRNNINENNNGYCCMCINAQSEPNIYILLSWTKFQQTIYSCHVTKGVAEREKPTSTHLFFFHDLG